MRLYRSQIPRLAEDIIETPTAGQRELFGPQRRRIPPLASPRTRTPPCS